MLKKTNFEKKNLKKHLYIPLRIYFKPKCIWLGQKLFTLKLNPCTNSNVTIVPSGILRNKISMGYF
jgi:hypothetical protein